MYKRASTYFFFFFPSKTAEGSSTWISSKHSATSLGNQSGMLFSAETEMPDKGTDLAAYSVPYTSDSSLLLSTAFCLCAECWQWLVGMAQPFCSKNWLQWSVLYWTLFGTHSGLCTHMHAHTSPTFCWVLLKKASSRKGLCVSAFKDLWVSVYENLLNRFFGEQSVTVPYTSELSHIWLLSRYWKRIIDFCELEKEHREQRKARI